MEEKKKRKQVREKKRKEEEKEGTLRYKSGKATLNGKRIYVSRQEELRYTVIPERHIFDKNASSDVAQRSETV